MAMPADAVGLVRGGEVRRAICLTVLMGLLPYCSSFAPPSPAAAAGTEKGCGVRALRACAREPVEISHPDTGRPSLFLVPAQYAGSARAPQGAHKIVLSTDESWGDGFHPTTSLSLQFLSQYVDPAKKQLVLDYGTGSAVLGLAALKLGARSVVGVDIDDEALDEAAVNVDANKVPTDGMRLFHTREVIQDLDGIVLREEPDWGTLTFDLTLEAVLSDQFLRAAISEGCPLHFVIRESPNSLSLPFGYRGRQVVANILIGPLMKLAPVLSLACKVGGRICLSGLRVENLEAVKREYARFGIDFDQTATKQLDQWRIGAEGEGEWAQISGIKRKLSNDERKALSVAFSASAVGEGTE